jgi:hypothetical protein
MSTLVRLLGGAGHAESFWVAFGGGAASWLAIYLLLPKPMRVYILGHELTHVLWTWIFGGRVKKFKATDKGGQVVVTKTNFLIVLAPYFFPLYAVLVVVAFLGGNLIWNWMPYTVWFHLLVGVSYSFHVTLTWNALQTRQSDITSQGYVFSAVVVFLGNMVVLLIGITFLTKGPVALLSTLSLWMNESLDLWRGMLPPF